MKLARPAHLTALLIALAGSGGSAWAQAACERYRAELASLTRSGAAARSYEAAAARHRDEIGRLSGYYRSIGCEGISSSSAAAGRVRRDRPAHSGAPGQLCGHRRPGLRRSVRARNPAPAASGCDRENLRCEPRPTRRPPLSGRPADPALSACAHATASSSRSTTTRRAGRSRRISARRFAPMRK